jgi:catechol 2,3-dioxygenase-like lactoylglutathione lyase family enzyme
MAKIKHLAIVAMNPEELAKFYCEVFEMKIIDRSPTGGVFLSDGYFNVALLPNRVEGKNNGLNHFGFEVDDTGEVAERLKKWSGLGPAARPDNRYYAESRATDPEGNAFDISEHGFQRMELGSERKGRKTAKV